MTDPIGAVLRPEVLDTIIPRAARAVLRTIITDGPEAARTEINEALKRYANEPVKPTAAKGSSRAKKTVQHAYAEAVSLVKELASIINAWRMHGVTLPTALCNWGFVPELTMPDMPHAACVDTSAPPLRVLRHALARYNQQIHDFLGVTAIEAEIAGIESLDPSRYMALWRLMFKRLLLVLFLVLSGRRSAMVGLDVGDFIADYVGPAPDRMRTAVLQLVPKKTVFKIRRKAVHPDLAAILGSAIFLRRLMWRQTQLDHGVPDCRTVDLPDSEPLFMNEDGVRASVVMVGKHFSGLAPATIRLYPRSHKRRWAMTTDGGQRPIVLDPEYKPNDEQVKRMKAKWNAQCPEGVEPLDDHEVVDILKQFKGYAPHRFRHLGYQQAVYAGLRFNMEHLPPPGQTHPDPSLYATAFVDHGTPREGSNVVSPLARIYGDMSSEDAIELLTLRVGPVQWELLATDAGLRRVPDMQRCQEKFVELRAVEQDLEQIGPKADRLRRQSDAVLCTHSQVSRPERPQPPCGGASEERLDAVLIMLDGVLDHADALFDQHQEMYSLLQDIHEHSAGMHELTLTAIAMSERRRVLTYELQQLLLDENEWLRVPDDEPLDMRRQRRLTIQRLEEDFAELAADRPELPPAQIRDWHTTTEIAEIKEINRATPTRWLKGESILRARPWTADGISADVDDGRFWLPGMRVGFFTHAEMELSVHLRTRWPAQQGWVNKDGSPTERSLRPLHLREPFATRYREAHPELS